jgi:hypothetical protein
MPCNIIIDRAVVLATDSSRTATTVRVDGRATECASGTVLVTLTCGGSVFPRPPAPPASAIIRSDGTWSVEIRQISCKCDEPVEVQVRCRGAEETCAKTESFRLDCQQACPEVALTWAPGECNEDGTRNVDLTATIRLRGATGVLAQWIYSVGPGSRAFSVPRDGAYSPPIPPRFAPGGRYTVTLAIVAPTECADTSHDAIIVIEGSDLNPCPRVCPRVTDLHAGPFCHG